MITKMITTAYFILVSVCLGKDVTDQRPKDHEPIKAYHPPLTSHLGERIRELRSERNECRDGLWGDFCQNQCSSPCEDGCDQKTGECRACRPGWHGSQCKDPCPLNCSPDLADRVYCDKLTGTCKGDCKNGFWSARCNETCSPSCANKKCHFKTGNCTDGCVPHHFGRTCQNICINCTNYNCTDTGECLSGCKPAHFGEMCNQTCSECKQGVCDGNGTCTLGCVDGFAGPFCDVNLSEKNLGLVKNILFGLLGGFIMVAILGIICLLKKYCVSGRGLKCFSLCGTQTPFDKSNGEAIEMLRRSDF